MIFTTKDLDIDIKYDFIVKELECLTFFIEVNKMKLFKHLINNNPISSIDLIWNIGYFGYGKRTVNFWMEILKEYLDIEEYTDEEYDRYIDFQKLFENQCVKKANEFKQMVDYTIKLTEEDL